jgi:hypothetical protein
MATMTGKEMVGLRKFIVYPLVMSCFEIILEMENGADPVRVRTVGVTARGPGRFRLSQKKGYQLLLS